MTRAKDRLVLMINTPASKSDARVVPMRLAFPARMLLSPLSLKPCPRLRHKLLSLRPRRQLQRHRAAPTAPTAKRSCSILRIRSAVCAVKSCNRPRHGGLSQWHPGIAGLLPKRRSLQRHPVAIPKQLAAATVLKPTLGTRKKHQSAGWPARGWQHVLPPSWRR